jgi:thiamine pyrophosphate-dependent acetolactate synthase large subunit-like protein
MFEDYVKCAEAVGAYRVRVERPADLGPALRAALAGERPAVLDVVIDPWQSGGKIV